MLLLHALLHAVSAPHNLTRWIAQDAVELMRLIPFAPSPYGKLQALVCGLDAMTTAPQHFHQGLLPLSDVAMYAAYDALAACSWGMTCCVCVWLTGVRTT